MELNIDGSVGSGANINLYSSNYSSNQRFAFSYNPNTGYYTISPSTNPALSLDVSGGLRERDANIQLWNKNSSCAQQWLITTNSDSSLRIASACSNLSLDVHGGIAFNEANISLWTFNTKPSEKWILHRAVTSPQSIQTSYYTLTNSELALSLNSSNQKLLLETINLKIAKFFNSLTSTVIGL